jgi:hypothetical protein
MADLKSVIGLLYRADWTRLSLSADVRIESDRDLMLRRLRARRPDRDEPPDDEDDEDGEEGGYHSRRATLLIAPGGRYRLEYTGEAAEQLAGSDGERGWTWWPPDQAPPPLLQFDVGLEALLPELFGPCDLLSEFALELGEPATAAGRDAIAVIVTPRSPSWRRRRPSYHLFDRLDLIVDAELGIVLRREETWDGQRLGLAELTAVVFDPPEAADAGRFEPPAGSRISEDFRESLRQTFGGPGWRAAKDAAGLAAGGLGAWIRFAPHRSVREDDREPAMPPAEPARHDPEDRTPVADDVLYLAYRSGENPAFTATLHEWHDFAAMAARVPDGVRAAGHGGVGFLLDAATRGNTVAHTVARLHVSGPDRYRVDYLTSPGRNNNPTTIACDGQRHWQAYQAATMVGPAEPLPRDIALLVDSSWLLGCGLAGGTEITYLGRRAYQLAVTRSGHDWTAPPLMFFPADAIVDAERGCLLRLICYAGDRPGAWWELTDLGAEPAGAEDFGVPPGMPTVEKTGTIADVGAVTPGPTGHAVRTAVDVARRTTSAVSAAKSFLDSLRGTDRPG